MGDKQCAACSPGLITLLGMLLLGSASLSPLLHTPHCNCSLLANSLSMIPQVRCLAIPFAKLLLLRIKATPNVRSNCLDVAIEASPREEHSPPCHIQGYPKAS